MAIKGKTKINVKYVLSIVMCVYLSIQCVGISCCANPAPVSHGENSSNPMGDISINKNPEIAMRLGLQVILENAGDFLQENMQTLRKLYVSLCCTSLMTDLGVRAGYCAIAKILLSLCDNNPSVSEEHKKLIDKYYGDCDGLIPKKDKTKYSNVSEKKNITPAVSYVADSSAKTTLDDTKNDGTVEVIGNNSQISAALPNQSDQSTAGTVQNPVDFSNGENISDDSFLDYVDINLDENFDSSQFDNGIENFNDTDTDFIANELNNNNISNAPVPSVSDDVSVVSSTPLSPDSVTSATDEDELLLSIDGDPQEGGVSNAPMPSVSGGVSAVSSTPLSPDSVTSATDEDKLENKLDINKDSTATVVEKESKLETAKDAVAPYNRETDDDEDDGVRGIDDLDKSKLKSETAKDAVAPYNRETDDDEDDGVQGIDGNQPPKLTTASEERRLEIYNGNQSNSYPGQASTGNTVYLSGANGNNQYYANDMNNIQNSNGINIPGFPMQNYQVDPSMQMQQSGYQPSFPIQNYQIDPSMQMQQPGYQPSFPMQSYPMNNGFPMQQPGYQPSFPMQSYPMNNGFPMQQPGYQPNNPIQSYPINPSYPAQQPGYQPNNPMQPGYPPNMRPNRPTRPSKPVQIRPSKPVPTRPSKPVPIRPPNTSESVESDDDIETPDQDIDENITKPPSEKEDVKTDDADQEVDENVTKPPDAEEEVNPDNSAEEIPSTPDQSGNDYSQSPGFETNSPNNEYIDNITEIQGSDSDANSYVSGNEESVQQFENEQIENEQVQDQLEEPEEVQASEDVIESQEEEIAPAEEEIVQAEDVVQDQLETPEEGQEQEAVTLTEEAITPVDEEVAQGELEGSVEEPEVEEVQVADAEEVQEPEPTVEQQEEEPEVEEVAQEQDENAAAQDETTETVEVLDEQTPETQNASEEMTDEPENKEDDVADVPETQNVSEDQQDESEEKEEETQVQEIEQEEPISISPKTISSEDF